MITAFASYDLSYAAQTVFAVSLLIAMVLLFRGSVARQFGASVAYALWLLPVARLILPPLSAPVSLMSLFHSTKEAARPASFSAAPPHTPGEPPIITPEAGQLAARTEFVPAPPALAGMDAPVSSGSLFNLIDAYLLGTLFAIWLGGALYMMARSSWAHHSFMRTVRREAAPASAQLQQMSAELGKQIGLRRVPFIASSLISSGPLVTGLFRPIVLLPAWFEEDYSTDQQRAALAHELTHVKRGDIWALQVAELFVACLWFNPLAYLARRAFRTDQEAACDSDVLASGAASPHAYGATLLKAVQISLPERMTAAASLPLTHALKERMQRMTAPAPSRKRRLFGSSAAMIMGSLALIGTSTVTATAHEVTPQGLFINNGEVFIDGEKVENRQIVVLSDPAHGLTESEEFKQKIEAFSQQIEHEAMKLSELAMDEKAIFSPGSFDHIAPMVGEGTSELLGKIFFPDGETGEQAFFMDPELMTPPVGDPEALEAWEARVEARAEAWAAKIEAKADAWGETWAVNFDSHMEAFEEQADAWAGQHEALMEIHEERIEELSGRIEELVGETFDDAFIGRIEARTQLVKELAEECRDSSLMDNQAQILTRATDDGHVVKIACVAGGPEALKSSATLAVIQQSEELDEEEKAKFSDRQNQYYSYTTED